MLFLVPGATTARAISWKSAGQRPQQPTLPTHDSAVTEPFLSSVVILCARCSVSRRSLINTPIPKSKPHHCRSFLPLRGCELKIGPGSVGAHAPCGVPMLVGSLAHS